MNWATFLFFVTNDTYQIEKGTVKWISIVFVAFMVILIFSLYYCKKQVKEVKSWKGKKEELEENHLALQSAYEQIEEEKKELDNKFAELKQSEEKSKKAAFTDYLTDLPNKTAFTERLDHIMLTLRKDEVVAIMFVDLDDFKGVNDALGHSYGDELLLDVTDRLKQVIDENDFLARIGGDEFVILTQNVTDIGVYDEKIKKVQKVFSYPFVLAMQEFFVTISIGVTVAPRDGKTTGILLKNVDAAMYKAKEMGKNTYYYYEESINKNLMEKIELQSELRQSIEAEEFLLYYQPQVEVDSGKVLGFEALVRWNHPSRGILEPKEFIALAEETGLILSIGSWVLQEACRQWKRWEKAGHLVTISVNLSARQFKDVDLIHHVVEAIEETQIPPQYLRLEVKEAVVLEDMVYAIDTMGKLRDIGVTFALDNFGTDYGSISNMKLLPIQQLKLDKSYFVTLMDNSKEQEIVASIIGLGKAMDLDVIAEGIEHKNQWDFLKTIGCEKAQGYFIGMPETQEEAQKLLEE